MNAIEFLRKHTSVAITEHHDGYLILSSGRNHRNPTERLAFPCAPQERLLDLAQEVEENDGEDYRYDVIYDPTRSPAVHGIRFYGDEIEHLSVHSEEDYFGGGHTIQYSGPPIPITLETSKGLVHSEVTKIDAWLGGSQHHYCKLVVADSDELLCHLISEIVWASQVADSLLHEWLDRHMKEYIRIEKLATRLKWQIKDHGFFRGDEYILWVCNAKIEKE